MTNNHSPELRPRLPRQAAADRIYKSKSTLAKWAMKKNKVKRKVKHHMVGNEAYYFVDELDEFNEGVQTF